MSERLSIVETLMARDGMSRHDATSLVRTAREDAMNRLATNENAWNICEEYFGLEPDYLDDLLF